MADAKKAAGRFYMRHAESAWNAADEKFKAGAQASTLRDAALSPAGEKQLASLNPPAAAVYSSPLTRAVQTALACTDGPVVVEATLREVRRDWGDVGRPPGELRKAFPARVVGVEALAEEWWLTPGCAACRPLHECEKCVSARCDAIRALMGKSISPVLFVGHGDLARALFGWDLKNGEWRDAGGCSGRD